MKPKLKVLSVIGTRPEAIKMAPVLRELARFPSRIESRLVVTGQHRQMLDQTLAVLGVVPDINLNIMRPRQPLEHIACAVLAGIARILRQYRPDVLLVQGDTTTALAAALAASHAKVAIGHVEAGLRTFDLRNPFPEEMNRRLLDAMADWCFAPTQRARDNLLKEGIPSHKIFVTGNTVVDAMHHALKKLGKLRADMPGWEGRLLLVTAHRRESWDEPLANICDAVRILAEQFPDLQIVYPVHLNPRVRRTVMAKLKNMRRIHLMEPVDYLALLRLMKRAYLILSDSGGIQEEVPTLRKPVLVMRNVTERPEAVEMGTAILVGTNCDRIVSEATRLLTDATAYRRMIATSNPYGDGHAAHRIVEILLRCAKVTGA